MLFVFTWLFLLTVQVSKTESCVCPWKQGLRGKRGFLNLSWHIDSYDDWAGRELPCYGWLRSTRLGQSWLLRAKNNRELTIKAPQPSVPDTPSLHNPEIMLLTSLDLEPLQRISKTALWAWLWFKTFHELLLKVFKVSTMWEVAVTPPKTEKGPLWCLQSVLCELTKLIAVMLLQDPWNKSLPISSFTAFYPWVIRVSNLH